MSSPAQRMRCAACGAGNRPQMTWCIECGEPLDGAALPEGTSGAAPAGPVPRVGRGAGLRGRGEWLLGVGLLLAVVLAGGVDWWQQEHGARVYHQGVTAAADRHWAAALAAFDAAGGYRDAPARAAAARATLRQITGLYDAARAAETRGDWAAAARGYSAVVALQPDYAGVVERLPAARTAFLRQQAAGTIYGTIGPDGGLTLARAGGAPWRLPGSDARSRVRLYAGGGRWVVYDGTVWPATGAHGDPTRRVLLLADLADPASPLVTTLPAELPPDGTGLATPAGFWWTSAALPGAGVAYYDYAAGTVRSLWLPAGWTIAATDPAHGWLVLAHQIPFVAGVASTGLFLSDAAGVIFEALPSVPGIVRDVQISADGRYVLFSNTPGLGTAPRASAQLILVRRDAPSGDPGSTPRRLRVLEMLELPAAGAPEASRLLARFVPGSRPPLVLSDHSDSYGRRQTLYNLDTGLQFTVWGSLPPPFAASVFDLSALGGLVLTQHAERDATRLVLQPTTDLTTKHDLRVASTPDSLVSVRISPRADYLLITVGTPRSNLARQPYTLYAVPLGADGVPGAPVQLYTGLYAPSWVPAPQAQPAPGGAALLYLTPAGALEVLTLDGAVRGALATDVRRVWVP